jgi:hypothetical protein
VILNSNPGIVSVEELDDQRYQANISPLQFPGSLCMRDRSFGLNMIDCHSQ